MGYVKFFPVRSHLDLFQNCVPYRGTLIRDTLKVVRAARMVQSTSETSYKKSIRATLHYDFKI